MSEVIGVRIEEAGVCKDTGIASLNNLGLLLDLFPECKRAIASLLPGLETRAGTLSWSGTAVLSMWPVLLDIFNSCGRFSIDVGFGEISSRPFSAGR